MRILYVFPEPLPLPKARAIQVMQTIGALAKQGAWIDLAYVPVPGVADLFAYYGLQQPAQVNLVPLSRSLPGIFGRLGLKSGKFFLYRLQQWLKSAEARGERPDAVFVRHLKLAYGLCQKRPDLPMIYEAHEVFADMAPARKRAGLARQERSVLTHARSVVSISTALAAALRQRYGIDRAMALIPSAADVPAHATAKDWSALAQHIVYAGSFFGWKGVDDLVAAAANLPGCTIHLVGGDRAGIERLQARLPASGASINFLGALSHGETLRQLAQACIAVLPNRSESVSAFTSPLKLFEYMAAGCAIVTSDLPVIREVLDEGDAAWFAPGDPVALAAALRGLVDDPVRAREMGRRVSARVLKYSWEGRARAILDLLPPADQAISVAKRS